MKKIIALISLALCMVFVFTACSSGGKSSGNSAGIKETLKNCNIEVLACNFDDEVTGLDEEFVGSSFQKVDGRSFVNLILKVENTSTAELNEENISAYFMHNDLRYDMQMEIETKSLTSFGIETVAPGEVEIVHLIQRIDEEVKGSDITVKLTVDGKEFDVKVDAEDTRAPIEKKTKVSVGDTVDVDGKYSFEVVSCKEKAYLSTTDEAKSEQYQSVDRKFVDMVIKLTNNSGFELKEMRAYTIIDNETYAGETSREINENTELEELMFESLKDGETEYCHAYAVVPENVDTAGAMVRFNLGGNCYYCTVE